MRLAPRLTTAEWGSDQSKRTLAQDRVPPLYHRQLAGPGVVLIWTSHGETRDIHMTQTTLRNEQISVRLNPDVVSKAP